ncbi:MAG: leucine--tRNA ligase [Fimbriimonadaceae bacterium]|jgi:leucyl-tRNA synthetase|nr:leucine--tRNA ligase [Fimbriimonadaceae bacterium]
MIDRYQPSDFESKWRQRWKEADLFRTKETPGKPKFYGLEFFPYPSGAGLSVGHCRNYIPTDVLCRMKSMQGYDVLHPMGFDAFGLPAENEAIKNKRHPEQMVHEYGSRYRSQMELIGMTYDWDRSFYSSDPDYYRWTQWIFKLLYDRGLAYRKLAAVNWDPVDKTVLADEEVIGGRAERSGALVEKKYIPQWFFKITDYAQRLLDDLDELDWPEGIKSQQRNWIGRSEGVEFEMKIEVPGWSDPESEPDEFGFEVVGSEKPFAFRAFTTRIDTLFGVTFCVMAPEHPLVEEIKRRVSDSNRQAIEDYQLAAKSLSDIDRQAATREKTGVPTGAYAINPGNGERVPLYLADYVLMGYGTGAIMAVPGHDQRDFDFAVQYNLDVIPVIQPTPDYFDKFGEGHDLQSYLASPKNYSPVFESKEGVLINSGEYSGLYVKEAQTKLGEWMEALGIGERKVNFKLRDWLISRQRYWGCPIPIVYDKEGNMETVPDSGLPVTLPMVDNYEPSGDGTSPLSHISEFVNCTTRDGNLGQRETDTMGGFACSSWYFLRFCDPTNDSEPWNPTKSNHWMPVDCYVGGAEHAVMHLLYARFWTKVLYDAGLCPVKEPFQRLENQGQVLALTPYRQPREDEKLGVGEDGILVSFKEAATLDPASLTWRWARMSKSKGNVVTPEEAVEKYGADALRIYLLFVTNFDADIQWSDEGISASARFLNKVFRLAKDLSNYWDEGWRFSIDSESETTRSKAIRRATHQLIRKATTDIEAFAFNTYISSLMIFVNSMNDLLKEHGEATAAETLAFSEALETLLIVLSPAAPHSADELGETLGWTGFTFEREWPKCREDLAAEDTITVAIQINGKLRDTIDMPAGAGNSELEAAALASEKAKIHIDGKTIRKVIVVQGKLVNIVAN